MTPRGATAARPLDQRGVRRHNLALILEHLSAHGPRSRATMAAETGLTRGTVSSLVTELIERGLLREGDDVSTGALGRPARSVEFDPDGGVALGLEIKVDSLAMWATDLGGNSLSRMFVNQVNREREPAEVIGHLANLTAQALAGRTRRDSPVCATIAVPGMVDTANGVLLDAPNLSWSQIPITELWAAQADLLSVLPELDNEARLAALGEANDGVARELASFVYLSGDVGVGAGLVIDRQLYRGAEGLAGEFGHISVERRHADGGDARDGTFERLAGQDAILERAGVPASDRRRSGPDWPGPLIARRLKHGDERTLAAVQDLACTVGVGVSTLANILNPEAVVLGGYFRALEPWLGDLLERELAARVISKPYSQFRVLFSELGGEAAVRGAARVSAKRLLAHLVAA